MSLYKESVMIGNPMDFLIEKTVKWNLREKSGQFNRRAVYDTET